MNLPRSAQAHESGRFLVRSAEADDFPILFALDQACFAPGIAWSKAELRYFLRYPGNVALAAEDAEGRVVGFAIGGRQLRKGRVLGRLITIDVEATARRQGVGQMLLGALEDRLRVMGAVTILLEVAVDNTVAQDFYKRAGFAATGRIPGYYLGRIDALVMEKAL